MKLCRDELLRQSVGQNEIKKNKKDKILNTNSEKLWKIIEPNIVKIFRKMFSTNNGLKQRKLLEELLLLFKVSSCTYFC